MTKNSTREYKRLLHSSRKSWTKFLNHCPTRPKDQPLSYLPMVICLVCKYVLKSLQRQCSWSLCWKMTGCGNCVPSRRSTILPRRQLSRRDFKRYWGASVVPPSTRVTSLLGEVAQAVWQRWHLTKLHQHIPKLRGPGQGWSPQLRQRLSRTWWAAVLFVMDGVRTACWQQVSFPQLLQLTVWLDCHQSWHRVADHRGGTELNDMDIYLQ